MKLTSKRAELTALVSGVISLLFFVICFVLGFYSSSFVVSAIKWHFISCLIVSIVLWFQFHLRTLAEQEKLELSQLDLDQEETIFAEQGSRKSLFAVGQKRLELFEKWFLPIFSTFIGVFSVSIGVWLLFRAPSLAAEPIKQAQITAIFMFLIAFVVFLLSRYATGMSAQMEWKPLRALGSWLLAAAVLTFAAAVCLGLAQLKIVLPLTVVGWAAVIFMAVLGAETLINIVFDFYRPRISGQYHRSSFDSRLMGILNEPGGVFHSIAHTIDYQFGFKVSQTWFYKLVEKAIIPLVLFSILTLWLMSSFCVIEPGEMAIIERFGKPINPDSPLTSGYYWKYPYPIDIVYRENVEKIDAAYIGFVPKGFATKEPLLWGQPHYKEEDNLIVGSSSRTGSDQGTSAFSIVVTAVPVHYRIKNIKDFLYNNSDTRQIFASMAYRELTRFAASARIETDVDSQSSLLGAGRGRAAAILKQNIQGQADDMGLGVEVVFVGLEGVHPPKEVAQDYQAVVGAIQSKQAEILGAMAQRNDILASLGGEIEQVVQLYKIARAYQKAKAENAGNVAELEKQFDEAMVKAEGTIFQKLRSSQSKAYEKAIRAKADGERFSSQLLAYQSAPNIYLRQLRLNMLEEALKNIRKYVVIADVNDYQVLIFDLQDKIVQSLYDIEGSKGN